MAISPADFRRLWALHGAAIEAEIAKIIASNHNAGLDLRAILAETRKRVIELYDLTKKNSFPTFARQEARNAALLPLWEQAEEKIRKHIKAIMAVVPDANEDDVLQDVLPNVFKAYDPAKGSFIGLAKTAARHRALTLVRRPVSEDVVIADIRSESAGPDIRLFRKQVFDRFFLLVFDGSLLPEQVIIFGYCRLLENRPREIIDPKEPEDGEPKDRDLRNDRLGDLVDAFEKEYAEKSWIPRHVIRSWLVGLRSSLSGKTNLGNQRLVDCFNSTDVKGQRADLSKWWKHVERVTLRKLVFDLPDILCDLVESPLHPHEIITYGCIELLGWYPSVVVRSHSARTLSDLAEEIEKECLRGAERGHGAIRQAFEDMRKRLDHRASAELKHRKESATRYETLIERDPLLRDTKLEDYFGVGDPKKEVAEWRDRARLRIKEWIYG